jgi:GNAT superfamily N-acetyltransferase
MAGLAINAYDRRYLEGMADLYNRETAFEPHIAPLDPERFVELVERKSSFDPSGLLVAAERTEVVGWVHACVAAGSEGGHDPEKKVPRIRMLIFPRERLKVGNALVTGATAWLRHTPAVRGEPELREFEAMHAKAGYPFYRGLWLGGEPMATASMAHVQLALEVGGYKNTHESVFMTAEVPAPPPSVETAVPIELIESVVEMRHEPMRESWIGFEPMRVQACVGGEDAGQIGWVILPHVAERLGAPCMNIWSLGVREQYRQKGIAGALIARALSRAHALGARFASVGTQLWNGPAHATYARFGFNPHCVLVGRALNVIASRPE